MQYHPGAAAPHLREPFRTGPPDPLRPAAAAGRAGAQGVPAPAGILERGKTRGSAGGGADGIVFGLLTVSADMRAFLKRTIAIWTGPNVDIRYEVDGHKLTELPEGYAPHYIPEGFSYNENNSFAMGNETIFDYENKEGHFIQITIRIAEKCLFDQHGYGTHTNFKKIDYGEGGAYLGTFEDGDGYTMYWFADGIEHELYISAALKEDEVFKIADGIYS